VAWIHRQDSRESSGSGRGICPSINVHGQVWKFWDNQRQQPDIHELAGSKKLRVPTFFINSLMVQLAPARNATLNKTPAPTDEDPQNSMLCQIGGIIGVDETTI